MKKSRTFLRKLNSRKGETLVEALVSIIIITLASLVLCYGVMSAVKANKAADKMSKEYNATLMEAEGTDTSAAGKAGRVTFTPQPGSDAETVTYNVTFHGDGSLASYDAD